LEILEIEIVVQSRPDHRYK